MFYRSIFHLHQFRYLGVFYLHSMLRLFAVAMFQIFSGIYIYQTLSAFGFTMSKALAAMSLIFALTYLVHAVMIIPALWVINKKGLRFAVFWGNLALLLYFLNLYLAKFDPIFFIIGALFSGVQIALYWTGFHIYLVKLTDDKKQGEELSISTLLSAIATIGAPAFGGVMINYGGYTAIFLTMFVLILLAIVPLRYLPKEKDVISMHILNVFQVLRPKQEFRSYLSLFGMGIIDFVALIFWPLYVFPIVSGFIGIGYLGSLVAMIAAVVTVISGYLIDRFTPQRIIKIFSPLDSIAWSLKILVVTPLQVFILSSISALTIAAQMIALDTMIYKRARHSDVIALVVQRELGLTIGRFLFLIVVGFLFWFGMPFIVVFIVAAVCSLFTKYYPYDAEVTKKS